uniref:Uncharacterized protein n=1 Tax=Romanomermis culicivorax TaxID=13658 RepID=A0A915JSZ6_ROMCU
MTSMQNRVTTFEDKGYQVFNRVYFELHFNFNTGSRLIFVRKRTIRLLLTITDLPKLQYMPEQLFNVQEIRCQSRIKYFARSGNVGFSRSCGLDK